MDPDRFTLTVLLVGGQMVCCGLLIIMLGGVLSILSVTEALAVLPALSIAVPAITCPAPSVVTVTGAGHDAMPDPGIGSLHVKETVTSVLFQPFALGTGSTAYVMTGATASGGKGKVVALAT